jgi:hypothetical protein
MTVSTGGRPGLFHGVTRPAHPVGNILAKVWYAPRSDLFLVAVPAFAFQKFLVCPVREGDPIL